VHRKGCGVRKDLQGSCSGKEPKWIWRLEFRHFFWREIALDLVEGKQLNTEHCHDRSNYCDYNSEQCHHDTGRYHQYDSYYCHHDSDYNYDVACFANRPIQGECAGDLNREACESGGNF
jgi:hypothetical protein